MSLNLALRMLSLAVAGALASGASRAATDLSPDVQTVLRWVVATNDHHGAPFMIIDKRDAEVWLFDPRARLLAHAPALMGLAKGDDSVPGIGTRPIPDIKPSERTTPAGRFVVEPGRNTSGEDIVWIDYDDAISMHRVRPLVASERRLERLASASPRDNRITYGCINVPVAFYERQLKPVFYRSRGIAYVLPEVHSLQKVFGVPLPGQPYRRPSP